MLSIFYSIHIYIFMSIFYHMQGHKQEGLGEFPLNSSSFFLCLFLSSSLLSLADGHSINYVDFLF